MKPDPLSPPARRHSSPERAVCALLIVIWGASIAAGQDTALADLALADGEWLIRVEIEGHEPVRGRLNVYSTGTVEYLSGKQTREGSKWDRTHTATVPPADLRMAYESARLVVRDFKLADQARPDIARDVDGVYVFTFATARRSVRLWIAMGEQRRDERLTEDLQTLSDSLAQAVPRQYLFTPRPPLSRPK